MQDCTKLYVHDITWQSRAARLHPAGERATLYICHACSALCLSIPKIVSNAKKYGQRIDMSAFEDYQKVCKYYDEFRYPIGAETELRELCRLGKPLKDVHIADIGCGTGNYSKYFLDNGVGKVSMFDGSEGMLSYAKTKVADYVAEGRVSHCETLQLPNPLPDGQQYDVICMNFVLHHLGSPDDDASTRTFPKATAALRNIYASLKSGGHFILLTCLKPQLKTSMWYHGLIDDLDSIFEAPIMDLAYGDYSTLEKTLKGIGFDKMEATVPLHETLMKPVHYYNIDAVFDPKFLQADSTFTLLRNRSKNSGSNETDALHQRLRKLKESNKAEAFMERQEELRRTYGCATVITARKP
ncbi:PREDICTED: uncharacterized protein LOC106812413 [Priapulus caudatus]|uniref:Uncharacterized protein LOC106812413 n=1 Tax=Priapulus caudatus TaxID=37621 RepID=A0ABM1EHV3_PRICU|nr:PREDICTED: uncharacterized protein LOC106812413 [Priapulus caudatus]